MTHTHRIAGTLAVVGASVVLAGCGESKPKTPVAETATTTGPRPATRTTVPAATTIDTTVDFGGVNPFAASSPWNTPVQSLERSRTSNSMINEAAEQPVFREDQTRLQAKPENKNLAINLKGWAPGVYPVGAGEPVTLVCRQDPCGRVGDSIPREMRLGNDLQADSAHDGWLVLVDQSTNTAYDLWRARRVGSTLSFEFFRKWTLDGDGVAVPATREPDRVPSVRGSGLPMLAGLIRPREAKAGRIPHTL